MGKKLISSFDQNRYQVRIRKYSSGSNTVIMFDNVQPVSKGGGSSRLKEVQAASRRSEPPQGGSSRFEEVQTAASTKGQTAFKEVQAALGSVCSVDRHPITRPCWVCRFQENMTYITSINFVSMFDFLPTNSCSAQDR